MDESISYRKRTDSCLEEVRAKIGRIPVIRRDAFVYGFLAILVGFGAFLLPPPGPPKTFSLAFIILFYLLSGIWTVVFCTDELKPEVLKTAAVFALIFVRLALLSLFHRTLGGDDRSVFQLENH
jgi:hypothetical protein